MVKQTSIVIAAALVACSGNATPGDAGSRADAPVADAGRVGPITTDCGGDDVLEVQVVDDLGPWAPDVPIEGATVIVDCAAGRSIAISDASGMARFEGLALATDPVDLTAYVEGLPIRTRMELGPEAAEQPYVFPMTPLADWVTDEPGTITARLDHSPAGLTAYCWSSGEYPSHFRTAASVMQLNLAGLRQTSFTVPFYAETGPGRLACIEGVLDATDQSMTMTSFAEMDVGSGDDVVLTFPADPVITRGSITIEHQADAYSLDRKWAAFVEDRAAADFEIAIGARETLEETATETTIHYAYAAGGVRNAPLLHVRMEAVNCCGGAGWSLTNRTLDSLPARIVAHAPPALGQEFRLADRVVNVSGAEWSVELSVNLFDASGAVRWRLITPTPTSGTVRIPAPPPGVDEVALLDEGTLFVNAATYGGAEPPLNHWRELWWSTHVEELAWNRADIAP